MDKKQMEIERYLNSSDWRELQRKRLENDKNYCALCGSSDATVAHRKFEINPWKERISDLTSLCANCEQNYLYPPTLAAARSQVMSKRWDKDNSCPVCDQHAVEYTHTLYSTQMDAVRLLMARQTEENNFVFTKYPPGHRAALDEFLELVNKLQGDWAKIAHFGIIEEDGCHRSMWRITPLGREFLDSKVRIPRKVYTYNADITGKSDDDTVFVYELPIA
jgi:hypothetical protein